MLIVNNKEAKMAAISGSWGDDDDYYFEPTTQVLGPDENGIENKLYSPMQCKIARP